ncbi:unnamed protein product [Bursaphelenchus okinawaensis]|uniref:Fork-head domain-containing protein n=1 Tax=Bursaphelenchus okinawaensis TaxID=465554 RepID=A0A811L3H1_9BILA|nr:unnamed protein product [Bursaphelenchus okinawaensis]CAG9115310.1 unnamed protein product [Bursaphelenchus okinawaensis]
MIRYEYEDEEDQHDHVMPSYQSDSLSREPFVEQQNNRETDWMTSLGLTSDFVAGESIQLDQYHSDTLGFGDSDFSALGAYVGDCEPSYAQPMNSTLNEMEDNKDWYNSPFDARSTSQEMEGSQDLTNLELECQRYEMDTQEMDSQDFLAHESTKYEPNNYEMQQNVYEEKENMPIEKPKRKIKQPSQRRPIDQFQPVSGYKKPYFSYCCLIGLALKNSPNGRLNVADIYRFLCEHFPFFREAPTGWKNSVRHNLSLNKCFKKVEIPPSPRGGRKSCLWELQDQREEKMEQELAKWKERCLPTIEYAMARPQLLDDIIAGKVGMPPPDRVFPDPECDPRTIVQPVYVDEHGIEYQQNPRAPITGKRLIVTQSELPSTINCQPVNQRPSATMHGDIADYDPTFDLTGRRYDDLGLGSVTPPLNSQEQPGPSNWRPNSAASSHGFPVQYIDDNSNQGYYVASESGSNQGYQMTNQAYHMDYATGVTMNLASGVNSEFRSEPESNSNTSPRSELPDVKDEESEALVYTTLEPVKKEETQGEEAKEPKKEIKEETVKEEVQQTEVDEAPREESPILTALRPISGLTESTGQAGNQGQAGGQVQVTTQIGQTSSPAPNSHGPVQQIIREIRPIQQIIRQIQPARGCELPPRDGQAGPRYVQQVRQGQQGQRRQVRRVSHQQVRNREIQREIRHVQGNTRQVHREGRQNHRPIHVYNTQPTYLHENQQPYHQVVYRAIDPPSTHQRAARTLESLLNRKKQATSHPLNQSSGDENEPPTGPSGTHSATFAGTTSFNGAGLSGTTLAPFSASTGGSLQRSAISTAPFSASTGAINSTTSAGTVDSQSTSFAASNGAIGTLLNSSGPNGSHAYQNGTTVLNGAPGTAVHMTKIRITRGPNGANQTQYLVRRCPAPAACAPVTRPVVSSLPGKQNSP